MEKLSAKMQERLANWRKYRDNPVPDPKNNTKKQRAYLAQRDYGDDVRDFEKKDEQAWQQQVMNNPFLWR